MADGSPRLSLSLMRLSLLSFLEVLEELVFGISR